MKRITSCDLGIWASKRDCQENLPLLVRKLIRASSIAIEYLHIPVGDDIRLPGYDGRVIIEADNFYLPPGASYIEIGAGEPKAKFRDDYKKRTDTVSAEEAKNSTFVFVTPHKWTDKDKWVEKAKRDNVWKDVAIIDGIILEEWIEQHPAVGIWLASHLNIPTGDIVTLEEFWDEWSKNEEYSIPATLVTASRHNQVQRLKERLYSSQKIIYLKSASIDESIAFLASVIETSEQDLKEAFYSRAIICETEQHLRALMKLQSPLVLITRFVSSNLFNVTARQGHQVVVALSKDVTIVNADIELPKIRRDMFEDGVKEIGFGYEQAHQLTKDSGQDISILRGMLKFERSQPEWAKNATQRDLIPALLAGSWDEKVAGDQSIVALLSSGQGYDQYASRISRWRMAKDAPIRVIMAQWSFVSARDSWGILGPFLIGSDFRNFKEVILQVLNEIDKMPKPESESIFRRRQNSAFSMSLRKGLCESLTIIAVFGDRFRINIPLSPQRFVDEIVADVLFDASAEKWCFLSDVLLLLCEASPDLFLRSVKRSLEMPEPPVMAMFGKNEMQGIKYEYTYLLSALEQLLHSELYLADVTLILGNLSVLQLANSDSNSPLTTLVKAFVPWYRQMEADFSLRKNVLQKLEEKYPVVAWSLFFGISPQGEKHVSSIHRCQWRFESSKIDRSVNNDQLWDFYSFLTERIINMARNDDNKIAAIVSLIEDVSQSDRDKLLQVLHDYSQKQSTEGVKVWNKLREIISNHREHYKQPWALPSSELDKLDEIYVLYTPENIITKWIFIFEEMWPSFPFKTGRREMTNEEREAFIVGKRSEALKEIYTTGGKPLIIELLTNLTNPTPLSSTCVNMELTNLDDEIFSFLNDETGIRFRFAQSFVSFKSRKYGKSWISDTLELFKNKKANDTHFAMFFLGLPQSKEVFELMNNFSGQTLDLYWSRMDPFFYGRTLEEIVYMLEKLMEYGRFTTVIDQASHLAGELTSVLLVRILNMAAKNKNVENKRLDNYAIGRIFQIIEHRQEIEEEEMCQLEWAYLSQIAGIFRNHEPKHLFGKLANRPDFFVEVVSKVYLPDEISSEDLDNEAFNDIYSRSEGARDLLNSWNVIPGLQDDGSIHFKILQDWIFSAREIAKTKKLSTGSDLEIGSLLARYPRNSTFWPAQEICQIIDQLRSEKILSSFRTEIFNSRGTSIRHPYEGGVQEKRIANYFSDMATKVGKRYPFTASALLALSKEYREDSYEEDQRAAIEEVRD